MAMHSSILACRATVHEVTKSSHSQGLVFFSPLIFGATSLGRETIEEDGASISQAPGV